MTQAYKRESACCGNEAKAGLTGRYTHGLACKQTMQWGLKVVAPQAVRAEQHAELMRA